MNSIKYYLSILLLSLNANIISAKELPAEIVAACGETPCEIVVSKMKKFAKSGSPHAQAVLSLFYREGYATELDHDRSVTYMKRAAKGGLAFAQYDLAMLHKKGYLVDKDNEKSDHWLIRSGKAGYKPALELLAFENKISQEEKEAYQIETRKPTIEEGDEVLTITKEKYTLTDLMDYLNSQGYGRNKRTGSRINGRGCGDGMTKCQTLKLNTPLGRTQFGNIISILNTAATAQQMASMPK